MEHDMSREEAEAKLREWGRQLDLNIEADYFTEAIENLSLLVMKGRLSFNAEERAFTYRLSSPLKCESGTRETITIKSPTGSKRTEARYYIADLKAPERKSLVLRDGMCIAMVVGGFFWKCTGDELPK